MKKLVTGVLIVLAVLMLTGCSLFESKDEETVGFLSDTVFTVDKERIGLSEWYLYQLPVESDYEVLYGEGLWDYPVGDKKMAELVKDEIRDRIISVKLVSKRAEKLGITLSEEDKTGLEYNTEEYYEKLGTENAERYGITKDIIYTVYRDNLLASRVYEQLTLNVDTHIPEEEVRHMVLQYVYVPKFYEGTDEEKIYYSEEECVNLGAAALLFMSKVQSRPAGATFSSENSEEYAPIELIADHKTLCEKLPDNLGDIAFNLEENEIEGIYETKDGFFLLDCVKRTDEESTDKARIKIIEEREKTLFDESYRAWEDEAVIKTNYPVWNLVTVGK